MYWQNWCWDRPGVAEETQDLVALMDSMTVILHVAVIIMDNVVYIYQCCVQIII